MGSLSPEMQQELSWQWLPDQAARVRNAKVESFLLDLCQLAAITRLLGCEKAVGLDGLISRMMPRIISHGEGCLKRVSGR